MVSVWVEGRGGGNLKNSFTVRVSPNGLSFHRSTQTVKLICSKYSLEQGGLNTNKQDIPVPWQRKLSCGRNDEWKTTFHPGKKSAEQVLYACPRNVDVTNSKHKGAEVPSNCMHA